MSLTSIRLSLFTNNLLEQYIQNGILPDALQIQDSLMSQFANFYSAITNTFVINQPTWQPAGLNFRDTSIAGIWNTTQQSAANDTQIAYQDMLETADMLVQKQYEYITRSNLIQSRLTNIAGIIQSLLLISNDSQGYTYAFYDNFATSNYISYISPFSTTAMVDNQNNVVKLIENQLGTFTSSGPTGIVNLGFLQNSPQDISFAVLNPVQSITPLSSAQLTDIFNNAATAWQQNITINGNGPLVSQLTVNISPLGTIPISQINITTQMTNPNNQLLIETLYSADGVSYLDVPSASNPQYIGGSVSINFPTVEASYIRFIITKNIPDEGSTYNIGFQYISFIQTTYQLTGSLYSTPISLPSSGTISKVAINPCASIPVDTAVNYFINYDINGIPVQVPISAINDPNPEFSKVINVNSLSNINTSIYVSGTPGWSLQSNGTLAINVAGLAPTGSNINIADPSITQTLSIYRNIGPNNVDYTPSPSGMIGFQLPASGTWTTYALVSNTGGSNINLGTDQAFINGRITNGYTNLNSSLSNLTTYHLDAHQPAISAPGVCDYYFSNILAYQSMFDFDNNFDSTDISIFTYDPNTGNIIINPIPSGTITMQVDCNNSFNLSPNNDGTFQSSSTAIPVSGFQPMPGTIINAGDSITIFVDAIGKWVNEIQMIITNLGNTYLEVDASMDNINWITVLTQAVGPQNTLSYGSIKLPNPVYCAYIRTKVTSGASVTIGSNLGQASINVYPPIFLVAGQIQTLPNFTLTGTLWQALNDGYAQNSLQTYSIYNYFGKQFYEQLTPVSYKASMDNILTPAVYSIVKSNSILDPYINNVSYAIQPIPNETSNINFNYNGSNSGDGVTSIIFQAQLNSSIADITPELQNYTVKLI